MILTGITIGLLLGLLAGGRITHLASVRLRWVALLVGALILRFVTDGLLGADVALISTLRFPLMTTAFALLLAALWVNRTYPGMTLAFVGILANALAIMVNGGFMPVWEPSLGAAGFTTADVPAALNVILPPALDADFLLRLGPLGDIIPIPLPFIRTVASVGDLFLMAGLAFFLFASVVRVPPDIDDDGAAEARERAAGRGQTGLTRALQGVASLERPVVFGGARARFSSPSLTSVPAAAAPVDALVQHPYVRLALNGSFSALWAGQLISIFGDRVNTVALAAIIYAATDSVTATAMAFVVATLPNLFLSPFAGTFVDRWDRKEVLVVSDILRAALVLMVPLAIIVNVLFAYPLILLMTSISIFFRPARVAILPQIVEEDDLITANSAMWVGETVADVLGYALAGLLVVAIGAALPLAFWLDSATYLASAVLLASLVVKRRVDHVDDDVTTPNAEPRGYFAQMRAGLDFLRGEPALFANTIQAAVAQGTVGALGALTASYALQVFSSGSLDWKAAFGFIETSVGAGNLVGGFVIGLLGARIAKGRMIIGGYVGFGVLTILMALSTSLPFALAFAFGLGTVNMAFIIPSQALFQIRTPAGLMGRVVSFRFALVFGAMTVWSGLAAVLLLALPAATVLILFSIITIVAGAAGWLVPALRDA